MARQLSGERCGCGNEPGSPNRVGLEKRQRGAGISGVAELREDVQTDPADVVCTLAHFC